MNPRQMAQAAGLVLGGFAIAAAAYGLAALVGDPSYSSALRDSEGR